ncbi:MAG TPA: carbonic anhydrase [Verrucomicrobiales bacterium]|nr:carbonic anhydrase [Verrucomicrobiales bacterium]
MIFLQRRQVRLGNIQGLDPLAPAQAMTMGPMPIPRCSFFKSDPRPENDFMGAEDEVITADEALARLREGNRRFVKGIEDDEAVPDHLRRGELVRGQQPFAIILGCSDSRVPAELVFDQGLGDLFVIRVAGNIVAPSQVGSVEFAAEKFSTRLVVVLGHSQCGAVLATLDELQRETESRSPNLRSIVDRIRPSVEVLLEAGLRYDDGDTLLRMAIRANIRASADHLRHGSQIIEQLIQDERLVIVGAEYSLDSGVVEFL